MLSFDFYLIRFLKEHPERRKDVAEFIYNCSPDSYFGRIGELANRNEINLFKANIETWIALIESPKVPYS